MARGWNRKLALASGAAAIVLVAILPLPLVAAAGSDSAETTVGIRNADGGVEGVTFYVDGESTNRILPATGDNRAVLARVTGSDSNGANDLEGASLTCVAPSSCPIEIGTATLAEADDDEATWEIDLAVPYWTPAGTYTFDVVVHEKGNKEHTIQATLVVEEILGLGLAAHRVNFGQSHRPGDVSPIESLAVLNTGNLALDVSLAATALDFVGSGTNDVAIPASAMEYGKASTLADGARFGTGSGAVDLNLAPGLGASAPIYLRLTVPSADQQYVPPGSYVGELTVTGTGA